MAQKDDARIYSILQELVRRTGELGSRMRMLEQRLDAAESRLSSTESSSMEKSKKAVAKLVETEIALKNVNDEILRLRNALEKINRQIGNFARKRDVREVEKMMELLTPSSESDL